jgi:hypothetical protein
MGAVAHALGLPHIAHDTIRRGLTEAMPVNGEPAGWERRLSAAAGELMWELAELAPGAVLDADVAGASDYEKRRLAGLRGRVVEVHCHKPFDDSLPLGLGEQLEVDTTGAIDVAALTSAILHGTDDERARRS